SATAESGKTRVLVVLKQLVRDPWFTGRVSAAVLVRKVDAKRPTLLLDESDAAFNGEKDYAEALRGILNTGYQRNGVVSLCVGQGANIAYKDFSTFSPEGHRGHRETPGYRDESGDSDRAPAAHERRVGSQVPRTGCEGGGRSASASLGRVGGPERRD